MRPGYAPRYMAAAPYAGHASAQHSAAADALHTCPSCDVAQSCRDQKCSDVIEAHLCSQSLALGQRKTRRPFSVIDSRGLRPDLLAARRRLQTVASYLLLLCVGLPTRRENELVGTNTTYVKNDVSSGQNVVPRTEYPQAPVRQDHYSRCRRLSAPAIPLWGRASAYRWQSLPNQYARLHSYPCTCATACALQ